MTVNAICRLKVVTNFLLHLGVLYVFMEVKCYCKESVWHKFLCFENTFGFEFSKKRSPLGANCIRTVFFKVPFDPCFWHIVRIKRAILQKSGTWQTFSKDFSFGDEIISRNNIPHYRDVSAGATGATAVAPKFSDTLTLFQPGGADYAHHRRGRT